MHYRTHSGTEKSIEEGVISEDAWQRWQASYAIRRRQTFIHILEAQGKHFTKFLMKKNTVILSTRNCYINLTHRDSDPGTWIVRRWRKFLWFKKQISSDWFNDEHQAMAFAHELKREHNGR